MAPPMRRVLHGLPQRLDRTHREGLDEAGAGRAGMEEL